jgi:flavin reductase (DIM6/NTAB) family NADH-FMN oxidoreductase RutF
MHHTPEHPVSHKTVRPPVLYVGTPVVLITTCNEDGTANISPMSSAWALGDRFVLGISSTSQCHANILNERECVLNFPSASLWQSVERIARSTGRNPVPPHKVKIGYEYVKDKFAKSGLVPIPSETVKPPRINECPIQVESKVVAVHEPGGEWSKERPETFAIVEVLVTRIHAHEDVVIPDSDQIDTEQWQPLLYVFRHYFGTGKDLGRTFKA